MRRYLEDAEYPASENELAGVPRNNDAPQEFVERLAGMGHNEFSNPDEMVEALEGLEEPEQRQAGLEPS